MKGFYIEITNKLLEKKHVKQMGMALWEYLWCLDKMTKIDDDGIGWVLGGKPIKRAEIQKDLGLHEANITRNLQKLEKAGYINLLRTPYGNVISLNKAKKRYSNKAPSRNSENAISPCENALYKEDKTDDKTIKIAEQAPPVWILEEKLQEMEKTPNSYLDIIATFIREKPVEVENAKQLSNIIGRYCRIAQKLSGAYTNKQIFAMAERIRKDNEKRQRQGDEIDWTLETIYKYLTK